MSPWHRRLADGTVVLAVHAQPGAKRTEISGLHGDALKVRVAAPALEDRANEALIEFLAKRFGVAKRDVMLVSGAKSREKRFEIRHSALDPEGLTETKGG
jgi:uncharacterized protein (TIGR00251 family)